MKTISKALIILSSLASTSYAAVTLSFQAGRAFDAANIAVADGTPYALLVSPDDSFAGGFGLNSGLATGGNANSVFSIGQTFSVGDVIAGDTVFGVGTFNGLAAAGEVGLVSDVLVFELGSNGLISGRNFAFYFFPDAVLVGDTIAVGTQAGGVNSNVFDAGLQPMIVPSDNSTTDVGYATGDFGGSITNAQSTAVLLIPEPSSVLLSGLGILFILRRKR